MNHGDTEHWPPRSRDVPHPGRRPAKDTGLARCSIVSFQHREADRPPRTLRCSIRSRGATDYFRLDRWDVQGDHEEQRLGLHLIVEMLLSRFIATSMETQAADNDRRRITSNDLGALHNSMRERAPRIAVHCKRRPGHDTVDRICREYDGRYWVRHKTSRRVSPSTRRTL